MVNFNNVLTSKELNDLNMLPYKVFDLLVEQNQTLTSAESITGGDIATSFTKIPGASRVYLGGVIAYSNLLKVQECLVEPKTIKNYGPVSSQVAAEMAIGIKRKFGSNISVATTGFAGPRTGEEPVGTVFTSVIVNEEQLTQKHQFEGERMDIIKQTTFSVLEILKYLLTNKKKGGKNG
ncbi:MAG: CinA family protein [Candidatus Margulisbacteria bacterium]|nr:CinA family protein [Candidatus Margulisiibacteriota bacterium]